MKNLFNNFSAAIFFTGFLFISITAAQISGTKTVCPTGCDYATLTAAVAAIQTNGVNDATVLELGATYASAGETFPLTFTNLTGAGAVNTITIRPGNGATNLAITSADATATVNLDNGSFVTFDGRAGGAGTAKQLTIENTNAAGAALRFINDASGNTIKYVALKGVATSAARGVVVFGTTNGANGNDNNTIDNCDIGDGATTPTNAVYSLGSTGTAAQNNSGNTVSNCNIFNFYAATAIDSAGVRLDGGNTDWTISGNSFYQTASRAAVAANVRAIFVNSAAGNNFAVTGNFIGGDSPGAVVTTQKWTTTGTITAYVFQGIRLNVGTTTPSSVQGNTVQNFVWTSSSTSSSLPGVWTGIYVSAGNVNIGTTAGNTIGSGTGTGSISVTTSGTGGTTFGIGSASSGTVNISNNVVGSITTNGSSTSISASLTGIQTTAGANTIAGNTVGSTSTANSLNAATSSTSSSTGQQVTGILSSSSISASITGNTVANLNNNYRSTASSGQIRGIATSSGSNTIVGNTIRNLSTTSQNTNPTITQSVQGISETSTTAGQTVSQNVVHSLSNTAVSAGVYVTGIYYSGSETGGTNTIARNFVHSLSVSSNSTSSFLNGMHFTAGTFTAQNNMVRVGIDASGASTAGASIVIGIYENYPTAGRSFYHNSVYIGGTQTSGAAMTFAFNGSTGVSNARDYRNNIFVNARANGGTASSKHYAVSYGGTTANPTGLTANSNIFYVSGTGGVFGLYNVADRATLTAWQKATGQDTSSQFVDPLFVNPTGDAATVDLHLQTNNPAEMGSLPVASVTDDYDGETRSGLTPTDIGADAGNFTSSSGDIFAPAVSYTALTRGSTANSTLTGFATVADNSGVAGGANSPRLYFKKSTDADVFGGNTSADNGWKYVAATNAASPYDFTIDYSIINGGSVAVGNTIQYFVVAQDAANNLGSSPAGATASANPPVQNVNTHGAVRSYNIVGTLSGTKTVCASGCDYPSLSGIGGLFAAINSSVVTGNLVINITGDLTEDGTNGLIQWTEEGAGNYTLTIQPSDGTMKTISGNSNGPIGFLGADRVTIDGRFNGAGRFLTFRNISGADSGYPISFSNDASWNTVRNSVIEGSSINGIIVFINSQGAAGNNFNTITENLIQSYANVAPGNSILFGGFVNRNNTVSNNELVNFTTNGISVPANFNDSVTITGNTIYQTAARTTTLYGIDCQATGTNTISGNTIRDLNTSGNGIGIRLLQTSNTTVSRNRIYSFSSASGSTQAQVGIFANQGSGSTTNIVNNQIAIAPSFTNAQIIYGILDQNQNGATMNVYYNSVLVGGTASGSSSSWAYFRSNGSPATLRDNIFFNNRTGGTGNHFAAGNESASGTFSSDYNLFVGTGATAANFFDSGTSATGTPVSFAQWKTATGGDTHSNAGNPDATYSTTLFVDPSSTVGDLHINATASAATTALVNNTGTPVSGIAADYDNDTRSATTPDIGADEFMATLSISSDQTIPAGNYDNIVVNPNVNATLGGIVNVNGTLTINCTATLLGGSATNYVVGNLKKNYCAAGSFDFPVGTASGYAPVTINAATGTFPADFLVRANAGALAGTDTAQSLTRNWTLTSNGITNADITFKYNDADVPSGANESNFKFVRRAGTTDTEFTPTVFDTTTNRFTLSGVTQFSDWTLGKVLAPTAAGVAASGRILTSDGRGLQNAVVYLTTQDGQTLATRSSAFGYFHFEGIAAGQTVIISVASKRYQFVPQAVNLTGDLTDLTLTALP